MNLLPNQPWGLTTCQHDSVAKCQHLTASMSALERDPRQHDNMPTVATYWRAYTSTLHITHQHDTMSAYQGDKTSAISSSRTAPEAAPKPFWNLLRNLLRAAVAVASKRECCEENVWHHFQVPVVAAVNDIFRSCFCFFDRSSLEMLEVEAGCPGFQEALQVNQLAQP